VHACVCVECEFALIFWQTKRAKKRPSRHEGMLGRARPMLWRARTVKRADERCASAFRKS
ncbi:MAG: hypothetical protein ACK55Z_28605, partial [bacterium]